MIPFGLLLYTIGAYAHALSRFSDRLAECDTDAEYRIVVLSVLAAPVTVLFRGVVCAAAPAVAAYGLARVFWDGPCES